MGSYGLANKLKFYPSLPLYSYSIGRLNSSSSGGIDDETLKSMITLEPSKWHQLDVVADETITYEDKLNAEADFCMVLGHNFEFSPQQLELEGISATGVVNDCSNNVPGFNGWSLSTATIGADEVNKTFNFINDSQLCRIGSILYGKSWTAPINVNVGQSYSVDYSSKQQKTISGKTLSTLNFDKVSNWGNLPAWELMTDSENTFSETGQNTSYRGNQRTGVRKWNVNFSMLNDSDILSQNQMITNNGWNQDTASDYSLGANGESLYNNQNSPNFLNSVWKYTQGSHLPVVVNISDSKNADQWAIVRITKMTMKESNPKFIDISMTLEEQV